MDSPIRIDSKQDFAIKPAESKIKVNIKKIMPHFTDVMTVLEMIASLIILLSIICDSKAIKIIGIILVALYILDPTVIIIKRTYRKIKDRQSKGAK